MLIAPCSSHRAHRTVLIAPCSSHRAHRTVLIAPCSSHRAHRTVLIAPCSSHRAHRTVLIAPCSSHRAHRTVLNFISVSVSILQQFFLCPDIWPPSLGPKIEIGPNKKYTPGELLIDSINTKLKIRTPQMGQNVCPKVAVWNYQKLTKWPAWGEGWGGWFFSCPKHSCNDKMWHTNGQKEISRSLA